MRLEHPTVNHCRCVRDVGMYCQTGDKDLESFELVDAELSPTQPMVNMEDGTFYITPLINIRTFHRNVLQGICIKGDAVHTFSSLGAHNQDSRCRHSSHILQIFLVSHCQPRQYLNNDCYIVYDVLQRSHYKIRIIQR